MRKQLTPQYEVETALTGEEAMESVRRLSVDLVLMDIVMPGMDGIEAVRHLKAMDTLRDIPVIMVTGKNDKEYLMKAFEAGAIDYINKPFDPIDLMARVRSALRLKRETDRRKAKERELEDMNEHLEARVRERTRELEQAYQELKKLDEMKTSFLSNVSHELKTPLTSVLGFAKRVKSLLARRLLPHIESEEAAVRRAAAQAESNMDIILAEAEWLTARINDILDVTRMETGEYEWSFEEVDPADPLNDALSRTIQDIETKKLELRFQVQDNLPMVQADRQALSRALGSLLSNAVKFTESGAITCLVAGYDTHVLYGVLDTGLGFEQTEHDNVFEKFRQVGDGLTDKPKGTGVGLPICKLIVKRHGGDIWAESFPGHGSAFYFTIPIHPSENEENPE
jgi:signal transduction histidine kinase